VTVTSRLNTRMQHPDTVAERRSIVLANLGVDAGSTTHVRRSGYAPRAI
jgi:hypothetical protein